MLSILETNARNAIEKHNLLLPGEIALVAVSGGPDSVCMLHIMAKICPEWHIKLVAAHLNHGIRGAESEEEASYTEKLCGSLNIELHRGQANVPERAKRQHISAQEAARYDRHAFLRKIAGEVGASRIALGQTLDDHIETVLLNILRGTGPEGLEGMPHQQFPIIRPLRDIKRSETQAYCEVHNLNPRSDSSNADFHYRRNRLRSELLPYLATYYNPGVTSAIQRMSDIISADNQLLEEYARNELYQAKLDTCEYSLNLSLERIQSLPVSLKRRVIRQGILAIRGHLQDISFEQLERIVSHTDAADRFSMQLPGSGNAQTAISSDGIALTIALIRPASSDVGWQIDIPLKGETYLERAGISIISVLCENSTELSAALESKRSEQNVVHPDSNNLLDILIIPFSSFLIPLTARSWQHGDKMRPFGLGGSKKLQDIFTDHKISGARRQKHPLLVDAGGTGRVLALVGIQRAENTHIARDVEKLVISDPNASFLLLYIRRPA